jgi:Protein of unknown function (DUF4079)
VTRVAVWIHPVLALATTALAVHGAGLALRGRRRGARGAMLLARHRRLMPWVYGLVVANFALGAVSRWLWREEDLATSGHFSVGIALVVLFSLGAGLSRAMRVDRRARAVHPWVGAAALLAAGVQIFLGLQIVPH